ncbi:MAG: glycoside hydrolase family 127 protein [Bacteroidales bacterium]|nr:glycoside hydrolase family 127 protein [Bacteroidales bacterium]
MKRVLTFITFLAVLIACKPEEKKAVQPVIFSDVTIQDDFWTPMLDKVKDVTLGVCIDQIENQTGRIRNFENAAKGEGRHSGIFFDDSDVYKALEGMAYSLKNNPDPVLEAKCDEWIDKFAAAQQPDGYINTFYTLTGLENRWKDMDKHEMYCAGHMLEAAIAYYDVTGKSKFLDVAEGMVAHMMDKFGPGKEDWVPGHEEIELALVKLYRLTGEKKYLDFARWLIDERGHGLGVGAGGKRWNPLYYQDEVPVRELQKINGHAVRSMYLFCGMADVAAYTGDQGYMDALYRLWDNIVDCKMYITGGIGHIGHSEGFSADYDLPNKEAYCETCASIGMVLWNWRMNGMTGDAKYIDILERSLYNGVLSGISEKGDRFFYVNPLESDGNHHRQAWYGCACCPSNACRFIPSVGNYIYGTSKDAFYVNLFVSSKTSFEGLTVEQKTGYPWNGGVEIKASGKKSRTIKVRIPEWCENWTATLNGEDITCGREGLDKGYLTVARQKKEDVIVISFDMPVKVMAADPQVKADEGKRALMRGPVVFCMEGVDNALTYDTATLDSSTTFSTEFNAGLVSGVQTIAATTAGTQLNFIPYYAWDNREACPMKVWVDYAE